MSSSERSAWIRLVTILIVFAPYFGFVAWSFSQDVARAKTIYVVFIIAAVVHGLLNGIGQVVAATIFGKEVADERDRAIEALALRVAYYVLISLLLGALATLAALGFLTVPTPLGKITVPTFVMTSQYVFCAVVVAELTRHVVQVICYRKAAWA
jgi:hypothetical protein